ncbi:amidohydrolase family protein [Abyssisolibacter fermentans]|uniref:amidohydrolase family protein n=1 Tax=Abyssisolibacter fermentans TaxID=1766203 RepID=UPI000829C8CE|nr:amidohydrolase family protein [Abyssisolibacter fermentans]
MKKILKNGCIITQNEKREIYKPGMMVIDDSIISYVGKEKKINNSDSVEVIDLKNDIVLPGFINCHTHLQASTLRGSIEGMNLKEYLKCNEIIKNSRSQEELKNDKAVALQYGLLNIISSGITSVCASSCDSYAHKYKMRLYTGSLAMKTKSLKKEYKSFVDKILKLLNTADYDYIHPVIFAHSLYMIDWELLHVVKKLLNDYPRCLFTIHVSESKEEVQWIKNKTQKTPIELLDYYGVLTDRTLLVHCTYINESDAKLIAKRGSKVVVCPVSNVKLGSDIPNIPLLLENKIDICIGTDGIATNNSYDLLINARIAYFLVRQKYEYSLSAQKLLDLISTDAATVLGNQSIGSIKEGNFADFLIFDGDILNLQPRVNIVENLIFSSSTQAIKDVVVGGEWLMKNNHLQFEYNDIVKQFNVIAENFNRKIKRVRRCQNDK